VATLLLPARHARDDRAEPVPAPPSGGTVLVVDDDPEILRYVARVLRAEHLRVVPCTDGVDALAHLAGGEPVDLVLLDWALPGLDGRRVREQVLRRQPRIPLLVISGHAREEYTALGSVDTDTPWLVKPFTPVELRAAVAALLARREAASGS
jgi:DNA-binding response OmpR family regulator